jgi:hypothetical protein
MITADQSIVLGWWKQAMRSFPSDGWDGAAEIIAAHDRKVIALEERMDKEFPEWREHTGDLQPRTRPPR